MDLVLCVNKPLNYNYNSMTKTTKNIPEKNKYLFNVCKKLRILIARERKKLR